MNLPVRTIVRRAFIHRDYISKEVRVTAAVANIAAVTAVPFNFRAGRPARRVSRRRINSSCRVRSRILFFFLSQAPSISRKTCITEEYFVPRWLVDSLSPLPPVETYRDNSGSRDSAFDTADSEASFLAGETRQVRISSVTARVFLGRPRDCSVGKKAKEIEDGREGTEKCIHTFAAFRVASA